jgi:hypothetical protein
MKKLWSARDAGAAGEIGEDGSVRSKILPSLEPPAASDITVGGRV